MRRRTSILCGVTFANLLCAVFVLWSCPVESEEHGWSHKRVEEDTDRTMEEQNDTHNGHDTDIWTKGDDGQK